MFRIEPFESGFTIAETVLDEVIGDVFGKRQRFPDDLRQRDADIDQMNVRERFLDHIEQKRIVRAAEDQRIDVRVPDR